MSKNLLGALALISVGFAGGIAYQDLFVADIEAAQKEVFDGFDELQRLGAFVISEDGDNLGKISAETYAKESLGNAYGKGSSYATNGIFNEASKYGNKYSATSAFNDTARTPPMIVVSKGGSIYNVGYLTTSKYLRGKGQKISPYLLKAWLEAKK